MDALFAASNRKKGIQNQCDQRLLFFFKIVFACTAYRTLPIIGHVFPLGSGIFSSL